VTVTTGIRHPSYQNPTIAEALCEIHFRTAPEKPWKPSLVGEFFKAVQGEFPEMEPVQELGLQVEVGEGGVSQKVLPPRSRVRFKHRERPLILQLIENVLTVNLLPRYPGWDRMSQDIIEAWGKARETLGPAGIARIGLRYINRIVRESEADRPGDWLRATGCIPPGVLGSARGFLARVEIQQDTESRIVVTLGDQPSATDAAFGAIILDIDRIVGREVPTTDDALRREINRLHEDVWQEFSAAQGEKLKAFLNGRQP
jgi:uncharacterized protein (TIGR04255 family)